MVKREEKKTHQKTPNKQVYKTKDGKRSESETEQTVRSPLMYSEKNLNDCTKAKHKVFV